MRNVPAILLLVSLGFFYRSAPVFGQIPWFGTVPILYNPSFAGSAGNFRACSNNSIQVTNSHGHGKDTSTFISNVNYLSADHFIGKIHTGVGMYVKYAYKHDLRNEDWQRDIEGSISVAPKFSFREKYTISPSLQVTLGKTDYNYDVLFRQINFYKFAYDSSNYGNKLLTVKTGLMYNRNKFLAAVSMLLYWQYHDSALFGWNASYINGINSAFALMVGYTFKKQESRFSFTPIFMAGYSPVFIFDFEYIRYIDAELYMNFKYRKFIWAVDLYLNTLLGYEGENFRIALTQQYTRLHYNYPDYIQNIYSTQLSLRYVIRDIKSEKGLH